MATGKVYSKENAATVTTAKEGLCIRLGKPTECIIQEVKEGSLVRRLQNTVKACCFSFANPPLSVSIATGIFPLHKSNATM